MREACERLARYIPEIERAYGVTDDTKTWVLRVGPNTTALAGLGTEVSLPELVKAVGAEVAARQNDES